MIPDTLKERKWWERPFVDLWTIPHTLLGVLVAALRLVVGASTLQGWYLLAVMAIVWEGIEYVTGISKVEAPTNSVTDVIVALAGYAVASAALPVLRPTVWFSVVVMVSATLFMAVVLLGWHAHRYYIRSSGTGTPRDRRR